MTSACCRQVVVIAAGKLALVQGQKLPGERVQTVEVIQQPAIQTVVLQKALELGDGLGIYSKHTKVLGG